MKITYHWDLSALGSSVDDPKFTQERKKTLQAYKAFHKKWANRNDLWKKVSIFKEAIEDYNTLASVGGAESLYLFDRNSLNSSDLEVNIAIAKYRDFAHSLEEYIRFFELKTSKLPITIQKKFLSSPLLEQYHTYLKSLFNEGKYLLGEAEEKILSMKSSVASGNWVKMLDEFLTTETTRIPVYDFKKKKYREKTVGLNEMKSFLAHPKKKTAKAAEKALVSILQKHKHVAEKEINSFLENKKIDDQLRGLKRPDQARHLAEKIESKSVDILLDTVANNYKISRDFHTFKAQLLKKKKLNYWNRVASYGSFKKDFSYPHSVDIVEQGMRKISDEFADMFVTFVESGQIDVDPAKGKYNGAFCMPSHKFPVKILLNHVESFRSVTTLAHEMGHGIHSVLSKQECAINYHHPVCTAEVASTFCEDFTTDVLLDSVGDKERLAILVSQLEDKIATVFRQVAAYQFEQELHETFRIEGYLPLSRIITIFNHHMHNYMGDAVEFNEDSGLGWMFWGHFRTPFYVYSYAMAALVSQYARKRFLLDADYYGKIHTFYSTGGSLTPKQIYKGLGVDINKPEFWQEGIDEIKQLLSQAKRLAKKLGEI